MPQTSETRAGKARASRNSLVGTFRAPITPIALQSQFLMASHHVRPEQAAMVAALVFGGDGNG